MALKITRRQLPKGTVHVTMRGPEPEPPADGGVRDEQAFDRLAPGDELALGEDGASRVVEPDPE